MIAACSSTPAISLFSVMISSKVFKVESCVDILLLSISIDMKSNGEAKSDTP